jgi:hypothetical protein
MDLHRQLTASLHSVTEVAIGTAFLQVFALQTNPLPLLLSMRQELSRCFSYRAIEITFV